MKRFTDLLKIAAMSLMAVLFVGSCQKPDNGGGSGMTDEDYPEVFVMNEKQPDVISVSDDDVVTLNGSYSEADFPIGSIIVSGVTDAAPQGFLYKVKSVKAVNGKTVITTENASLEEAIKKGSGSASFDLVDHITAIYDADGNPVPIENTKAVTVDGSFKLPVKVKLETEREGDGFQGSIDVTGSLEFKATMFADIDFDWGLDYFELWFQPECKFNLSTNATLDGKWKFPKVKIFTFDIAAFTMMAGPIPVVFTPHMELYLDFEVDGKLKLSCELVSLDYKYKAGVQYDGDDWHMISEDASKKPKIVDNIWTDSDLELEGEFKALNPEIALIPDLYNLSKVADVTKASSDDKNKIKITTGIPFTIKVSNIKASDLIDGKLNPKIKTTWGVEAGVKVNLTVLKKAIVDYNPKINLVEWVIFDNNLFPELSNLEVVEDNGDKVTFSYDIKDVESVFFNNWYYGFSWSEGTLLDSDDKHANLLILGDIDFDDVNTKAGPMMTTNSAPRFSILSVDPDPSTSPLFVGDDKHNFHVTGVIENLVKGKPYTFRPYVRPYWWGFPWYGEGLYYTPGSAQKPIIEVSPSTVSFGTVKKGETSNPQTLTITNKGDGDLNFSLPAVAAPFSIEGANAEYLLKPNESKQFKVTFKPTAEGSFSKTIDITSNGTNGTQTITFTGNCGESTGNMEYVDLGLSVKWATCNLGATKPEEYGLYYQWGDTQGYSSDTSDGMYFDWSTYKWCNGSYNSLTKYNTDSSYGTVDNKTVLDMEDDAARAALGGNWRMPTDAEWTELRENCTWTWTKDYNGTGVAGRIVTSNKTGYTDRSIFLPAAGSRYDGSLWSAGSVGYYWSSLLFTGNPSRAWYVYFNSGSVGRSYDVRYSGRSVRPVYTETEATPSISVTPTDLDFGTVKVGSSATASFTVTNTGSAVANVSISAPSAPVTSDVSGNITLNAGEMKTVTLTYSPKEKGSVGGSISVVSGGNTVTVRYSGNAEESTGSYSYEYVDLGLSVKWATCNLGATKPEEYGLYYQWGDTQGYGSDKSDGKYFDWSDGNGNVTYKWCNGSYDSLTKYNTDSSYGTVDNKMVLDMEDDAARAALGGNWRMPTDAEWTELRENCTWTLTKDYNGTGVAGRIVTSNKTGYTDRSIFLPAAGSRGRDSLYDAGSRGNYWSSSLWTVTSPLVAWSVYFDSYNVYRNYDFRYYGLSVRPVLE